MNEGHIYIDGVITEDYHLQVKKQISNLGDVSKIVVHIQSGGGSVYAGYNCYHLLKSIGKPVDVIIEGECQSIATFIALAGSKIIARQPSIFMIHNPYTQITADASALENGASELRKIEDAMVSVYQQKTNLPEQTLRDMMAKETSMSEQEAMQYGFIDEVIQPLKMVAFGKKINNKKLIKMEDKLNQFGAKMSALINDIFGSPVNMDVPLKDGTMIKIDIQQGEDPVGKIAIMNDQPAPIGEYEMMNGQILVVGEGGVITEVKEAMNPMQILEDQNASLKAEIEALKAEKIDAQAKNEKTFQALSELQKEFVALRKMTAGNPNPPASAPVAQVKPVSEVNKADTLTDAFIKEYLPQFKK